MYRKALFPGEDELEERFIKGYKRPLGMAWLAEGANGAKERLVPPTSPPPESLPEADRLSDPDPDKLTKRVNGYVYISLRGDGAFWLFLTHIERAVISGYKWTDFGWVYSAFELREVSGVY